MKSGDFPDFLPLSPAAAGCRRSTDLAKALPMLSYRHAFHAGGIADVLKHATLAFVLRHLTGKPKPLYLLDTHAGAGSYDLTSPMAARTGEFKAGIGRLLEAAELEPVPALVADYLSIVRAANEPGRLTRYPGSPAILRQLMRPEDRLELAELHGTDHAALAAGLDRVPRVRLAGEDGLAMLDARMPPPERRGLVLIDPSYEVKTEAAATVAALGKAWRRFRTGVFLLWYPVIERARTEAMLEALGRTGIQNRLRLELCHLPDAAGRGMTGSGLIVVNPPWTLQAAAAAALPWLARTLGASGPIRIDPPHPAMAASPGPHENR
jgi:23S rRNA (adenine2030-N6)-methyltransferase